MGAAIGVVVEGLVDRAAVARLLLSRRLTVDPARTIVTGGKVKFDARIGSYNQAARFGPWLAVRDADRDAGGCPVALRSSLLSVPQSPAMCLRLAVRTVEAWLLADAEAFAAHFAVPARKVPREPERVDDPKHAVVTACRSSRSRSVRQGVVPPSGGRGTGPEYSTFLSTYCRESWAPDRAADNAPSLRRALAEIDRLVASGVW